jgi:predicted DNA-binding transcriptional regulator AlpA
MMKAFPKYVRIESSGNVTVQESEVSLWNAKNISVSGDVKKR